MKRLNTIGILLCVLLFGAGFFASGGGGALKDTRKMIDIIWEKDADSIESSAVNSNDEIIIASSRKIYLLDASGSEVWSNPINYISGYYIKGVAVDSVDNIIAAGSGSNKGIIVKYGITCGNMGVNPTSWSPTIEHGHSDSQIVTVSASGGPVKGVTVSKISGPAWLSVSPTNLGDIASGSSKTFTMTASPPSGTSGDFTYTVRVSNTCGTPSSRDVTGTIHVRIRGDVNCDDQVNMGDVGLLHNYVQYGYPICDEWAGDVNCDYNINMGDVGLLHNHVQYGYPLSCC